MITFTVHEPPRAPADRIDRAAGLLFVADRFDRVAALLAPFALLSARLFAAAAVYAVVVLAAAMAIFALEANPVWLVAVLAALHLVVGFEIGELKRHRLEAAGWTMLGTVAGPDLATCERRFLDDWLPRQPLLRPGASDAPGSDPATSGVLSVGTSRGRWWSLRKTPSGRPDRSWS